MTEAQKPAQTITIDEVQYQSTDFSPAVQQAVEIYNIFQADLQKAQLEVIKSQAALQSVGAQIADSVKKELAEKAASVAKATEEVKSEAPVVKKPRLKKV